MNVAERKQTVYHLSPLRLWLAPGILVVIGLFILVLPILDSTAPDNTKNLAFYMGIAFLAFAAVMYLILRYTRLVLSADGVNLYQFGYKLKTDWDNVAVLYAEPGAEGLVLHHSMDCPGARILNDYRHTKIKDENLYNDEQIQLIAEYRFIPLNAFGYWLKNGQLRDDLIHRAPGLNRG